MAISRSKVFIILVAAILVVGGVFTWQYWPWSETPQKEGVPVAETTQDETAHWQTYRNGDLGFEVRYPSFLESGEPGCRVSEINGTIFIDPMSVSVQDTQGLSLEEFVDRKIAKSEEETKQTQAHMREAGHENYEDFGSQLLSREDVFVGRKKGIKLTYQFVGAGFDVPVFTYVKQGEQMYTFRTNDANLVDQGCAAKFKGEPNPSEAMELMLSTLQFLK